MVGAPAQVLVVDDDPTIRALAGEFLADEGYHVRTASNGREALAMLSSWQPQVILLDLAMPEMDGWTFLVRQRADPALIQIPVIVMSAHYNLTRQRPQLPTAAVLTKPFEIDHLLTTVGALIGSSA